MSGKRTTIGKHMESAKESSFWLVRVISNHPLVVILIAVIAITGIISPHSIYPRNLLGVTKLSDIMGVIAVGQTLVMLTGGVDLSTGAVTILSLVLASGLMQGQNSTVIWVVPFVIAIAIVIGLFNALVVLKAKVEPMIATLVSSAIIQGGFLLYSKGAPKGAFPPVIRYIGRGVVLGSIPVSVIFWLSLSVIIVVILHRTRFGRSVYYVGSNRKAAELSGIRVERTLALVYIISSVCSAIAGLLLGGFIGIATLQLNMMDYSFTPLTAVLMGGTTFLGAEGGVGGTILGVFTLQLLTNLLIILHIGEWARILLEGVIIIGFISFFEWRKKIIK